MATTLQRMDEGLDRLEALLKFCLLCQTDEKNQPLQGQFSRICRKCDVNGHKASECSRSSYEN